MKKVTEKMLKGMVKMAEKVNSGNDKLPPLCIGYFYQPKRPKKQ